MVFHILINEFFLLFRGQLTEQLRDVLARFPSAGRAKLSFPADHPGKFFTRRPHDQAVAAPGLLCLSHASFGFVAVGPYPQPRFRFRLSCGQERGRMLLRLFEPKPGALDFAQSCDS